MIKSIEFRKISKTFQEKLGNDIKQNIFTLRKHRAAIFADIIKIVTMFIKIIILRLK